MITNSSRETSFSTGSSFAVPVVRVVSGHGSRKTAVTLHAINTLIDVGEVSRVLITAPLRVCQVVWVEEAAKWISISPLTKAIGPKRSQHLAEPADVVLVNHDMLHWIEQTGERFDLIVFDESSCFKNWSTRRTKAARRLALRTPMRLLLTGTPSPNHYGDLFAQTFLVDRGAALGDRVTMFRHRYMAQGGFEGSAMVLSEREGSKRSAKRWPSITSTNRRSTTSTCRS